MKRERERCMLVVSYCILYWMQQQTDPDQYWTENFGHWAGNSHSSRREIKGGDLSKKGEQKNLGAEIFQKGGIAFDLCYQDSLNEDLGPNDSSLGPERGLSPAMENVLK